MRYFFGKQEIEHARARERCMNASNSRSTAALSAAQLVKKKVAGTTAPSEAGEYALGIVLAQLSVLLACQAA